MEIPDDFIKQGKLKRPLRNCNNYMELSMWKGAGVFCPCVMHAALQCLTDVRYTDPFRWRSLASALVDLWCEWILISPQDPACACAGLGRGVVFCFLTHMDDLTLSSLLGKSYRLHNSGVKFTHAVLLISVMVHLLFTCNTFFSRLLYIRFIFSLNFYTICLFTHDF